MRIPKLFLSVPAGYFITTRLNTKSSILFHGYAEFLLGILLLCFSGMPFTNAVLDFVLGYFAFISIYEIGYIFNDFVSIRFEEQPRKRIETFQPSNNLIVFWIVVRIVTFGLLSYYLGLIDSIGWWLIYGLLALSFTMHNTLQTKQFKILTFISLACLRFYLPLFPFLSAAMISLSLPGILLFYVFFRTITYMDSKGLLQIPGRNTLSFKCAYYLFSLPLSFLITIFTQNWICCLINLYFLLFWGMLVILQKLKFLKIAEVNTE